VSMSVIAGHQELTLGYPGAVGERTKILHNPVFFTTSLLSVPPGDNFARGKVVENPTPDEMRQLKVARDYYTEPLPLPEDIQIQSLLFPKTHWERPDQCAAWANNHGYETAQIQETPGSFVIQHKDPGLFVKESFKVQCVLGADRDQPYVAACRIKAVVGCRIANPVDGNKVAA